MARRDAYVVAAAVIAVLCISSLRLSTSRSRAAPPPVAHAAALTELGLVAERLATTAARQEKTLASLASSASATRSAVAAFERGDALARAPSAAAPAADGATVDGARAPFVFVAGLEGTGHHWYKSLFEQCGRRCRPSLVGPLAWQRAAAVFNSKMAADAPAAELAAAAAAREAGEGPGATTWILNALGGRNDDAMAALKKRAPLAWTEGEGMASYPRAPAPRPNWWGTPTPDHKALQMPSLGALADAFRDGAPAAAQLRVSLATRDAAAIVRSVCDKRNFAKSVGGCASEVAILALGAGALAAQVDALPPPPLALCDHFAFEDLAKGDAAALARLGPFLGLDDAGALARRVKAPHTPSAPGPKDAKGQRDRATLVAQLAAAQDSAVAACARQRRRA
ncbi:hypothetical protein AURANDRAFT_65839 [Aureococcus anophagefferens]|uniref:Uncharacterized protein n=1 Tax=Aureococcus anophagefferens TaxID=44056 RepID=F0YF60_AURAN|nr:hypothetical protein AURANDRAFT_65839 [Aureococcus anophagefferens]EGB06224.1 hypothetical protein AURANDRAFT_65839 [Aureococcus anophagefferens]|eukprot:XP_009039172.1 hypothetical protein AURANDRAFT_65839 [Aureococcus anophagefferens]